MRRYTNKIDFDVNPTRDLRRALVIAVGDENLTKLAPVVRQDYFEFAGMRLWWPNMDYWSLKWSSIDSERTSALQKEYAGTDKVIPAMNIIEYLKYVWPHIKPFFHRCSNVRSAVIPDLVQRRLYRVGCAEKQYGLYSHRLGRLRTDALLYPQGHRRTALALWRQCPGGGHSR